MINLSKNAITVLKRRYLKNNSGIQETPEQLFKRVAHNISQAEKLYGLSSKDINKIEDRFYNMMVQQKFLPNSPTLMNAGHDLQQLSACFVLPIEDSMESIFETVKNTATIHKTGGGTGFSFSRLRQAGSCVKSTNGVSTGPISFMRVFNAATEAVKQGGRRRGANIGILRVDHPDILDFINCKQDPKEFNNFNISVAITDKFMDACKNDGEYDIVEPHTGKSIKKLHARKVMKAITKNAWKNGEPGIIFIDKINQHNPTPDVGTIESTNPCGEVALLPFESCNLGSINLSKFVDDGKVNYMELKDVIYTAVRFLDNIIDMNKFPLKEIEKITKANRKIGLGVMGFADMLLLLEISYNSNEAIDIAGDVMRYINTVSKEASAELAKTRGVFLNYKKSIYYKDELKIRNATTTVIAPTGSISIIADCSSGIEPLFALSFTKTVMDKDKLQEFHPLFKKVAKERGFYSKDLMNKISHYGSIQDMNEIPEDVRRLFVTSHDISPEWHVKMQATFQRYVDNAVSKTVNFSDDATESDVEKVFSLAYESGCKGITVYRDGSRDEQVLSTGSSNMSSQDTKPLARPSAMQGVTHRLRTGCGNIYITLNKDGDDNPFEVFTQIGKAGGCVASQTESISRLVSLALRTGVSPEEITKQLQGISCHLHAWDNGRKIVSCADAIGKVLLGDEDMKKHSNNKPKSSYTCPDCWSDLVARGGCFECTSCGYSKCG